MTVHVISITVISITPIKYKIYPPKGIGQGQGFLTGGKFPPWGKYWEFRGEMRAFENCCLFKTGDTKWFP